MKAKSPDYIKQKLPDRIDERHSVGSEDNLMELFSQDTQIINSLQDLLGGGLSLIQPESTNCQWMDGRLWQILGYSGKTIVQTAHDWKRIINRKDYLTASTRFQKVVDEPNELFDFTATYTHRDGSTKWIRTKGKAHLKNNKPYVFLFHQDITKEKRIELLNKNYDHVIEQTCNIIIVTDKNGTIEYVNNAFVTLTGYKKEDVVGKNPRLLKSGNRKPQDYRTMWKNIQDGKRWMGDFQNKRKDGTLFWVRGTISPIFNENGDVIQFMAIQQDITDRKNAERTLEENERKFRLLALNTADGLMILNDKNKIEYVSPSYIKILGYSSNDEINRTEAEIFNIIHPDDRGTTLSSIHEAIEFKKETLVYQYRAKHKKGHYIWREDHARFIYEPNGKLYKTYVVCRDITEIKLADEALKDRELQFSTMFNEDKSIKLVIQQESGTIIRANPAAKAFYGYPNLVGMNIGVINQLNTEKVNEKIKDASTKKKNHFLFNPELSLEIKLAQKAS